MDILEIFQKRRSARKFKEKALTDDLIEKVIYAASLAPTARNIQPWEFIVIKDKGRRKKIAEWARNNGPFIEDAAVCIAVMCHDTKYYLEDGSAATTQLLLCAAHLGLGACWVAGDKKEYAQKIEEFLEAPKDLKLVSLVALGYAKETPVVEKKKVKELIHWEHF